MSIESNYFEIDVLDVGNSTSGDAIGFRSNIDGNNRIHVIDGGYLESGENLVKHINKYYNSPDVIDAVIVTHADGDHSAGLRHILESFEVSELWMLRPWDYADELLPHFSRYTNRDNLIKKLREIYSNIDDLEKIAEEKGIPIYAPLQGVKIGDFFVMAPSRQRYLDLVVESDKTPDQAKSYSAEGTLIQRAVRKISNLIKSAWGVEIFPDEGTSKDNEMSVVQYAEILGKKILFTGDVGREGLLEASDYAPYVGLSLPGIDKFQVPHHGSRRNVSTETLDIWLGERKPEIVEEGEETFTAFISAAKDDEDHPKKAVIRAMKHRGAEVISTEGKGFRMSSGNAPDREGWSPITPLPYPEEQEED